jgi:hypothetical protein
MQCTKPLYSTPELPYVLGYYSEIQLGLKILSKNYCERFTVHALFEETVLLNCHKSITYL